MGSAMDLTHNRSAVMPGLVPGIQVLRPTSNAWMAGTSPAMTSSVTVHSLSAVMPGLVPGIHVLRPTSKDVDGRDKPGHDGAE